MSVNLAKISIAISFLSFLISPVAYSAELKTVTVNGMTVSEETAKAMQGGCGYDPYEKLKGFISGGNIVPKWVNGKPEAGIDPALACRLSKMLEAMKGRCNAKIISGHRSANQQESMCGSGRSGCAAPGRSCHQYGLAVDLSTDCNKLLRQVAPQFQLGFPYYGIHVQCAEHKTAGRSSCSGPCNGGIEINPDANALANAGSYSPSSGISNMFRQALGLPEQPQQPPPPPTPQQALPQSQQPTQYFPSSSGSAQPTSGSSGTSGSTGQSPVSALSPTSQQYLGVTQPTPYQPSISEQLLQMAYGTTTQNIPQNTGTTVPLFLNPNDIGTVQIQNPTPIQSTTSRAAQSPSIATLQPSQTFTSSDLNYAPRVQQTYTPPQSGVFAVLENLKTILLRMLEILRPMGISNAIQGGHVNEFAE